MDHLTKKQRSENMKAIKSKNTKIELILRKALWHNGVRYRKNYQLFGCHPDIVITKHKIAIFCDGDFWHGNESKYTIKTNQNYWNQKILRNKERDLENTLILRDNGWTVLRYWGSEINNNLNACVTDILQHIK